MIEKLKMLRVAHDLRVRADVLRSNGIARGEVRGLLSSADAIEGVVFSEAIELRAGIPWERHKSLLAAPA